ncbi:hypothetical protein PGIGA_G00123960, partial [Pangasianodon gigas]|nr:hypothetical protein [Pangasianodon gigas]
MVCQGLTNTTDRTVLCPRPLKMPIHCMTGASIICCSYPSVCMHGGRHCIPSSATVISANLCLTLMVFMLLELHDCMSMLNR